MIEVKRKFTDGPTAPDLFAGGGELVQIEATPPESEQGYHRIIQGLAAAVYTCDAEGRIMFYNEAAVALWGRKPEQDLWCGSRND